MKIRKGLLWVKKLATVNNGLYMFRSVQYV